MRFTKMHGLGNDYVYVDCFHEETPTDPSALSVAVAKRRTGIGSDGLILIEPSTVADARMRIYNADGSRAKMCGNGIRCVGRYLYDHGIVKKHQMEIETDSGIKYLSVPDTGDIRVDMGKSVVSEDITVNGYPITPVSVGNPHAVIMFSEQVSDAVFYKDGPLLEKHEVFPGGVNVEFCVLKEDGSIDVRVWERGSGETAACGTGACAVFAAYHAKGLVGNSAKVFLPGGPLLIEADKTGEIYMTGPAVTAFTGEWNA